ncbi:hypothetical protein [Gallaecimonas xiamenensis]|uniref:Uncharacterized protein n=1 Tax=Gallaecimonas xiamenensis 3-C-1 TaxID=745411 RepID=K2JPG8_9GAMM|nr:hypothetical protein [Gallaecimonas xiamenensis]EKE72374.1 hypothetical protein B3C1_11097 [Gallaecimonas xiamenensis 3-C-1]
MIDTSSQYQQERLGAFLQAQIPALLSLAESVLAFESDTAQVDARVWDLLESWQQLGPAQGPATELEQAFWDLLGLMHRHQPYQLRGHRVLRQHLEASIRFLKGQAEYRPDGIAVRP